MNGIRRQRGQNERGYLSMSKKKIGKKWIAVPVLVIAAGVVVWVFPKGSDQRSGAIENWSTEEVTSGTIRITTEGNGSIEAAKEQTISSDYAIKIDTVYVENGDMVEEGDVIASVDADSVTEQIEQLITELDAMNDSIANTDKSGSASVTAPISGRVKRIFVKEGETLEDVLRDHGGMMELSIDGKLKVAFTSDQTLSLGEEVTVAFLNYEEKGIVAQADQNQYTVVLEDSSDYPVDTEAVILDEEEKQIGSGYLKSNHSYMVDARYGTADEIYVSIGEYVDKGETLLTREDYEYNQSYLSMIDAREELMEQLQKLRELENSPEICAKSSGIISELMLKEDTAVAEDTEMYHVISTDSFWLKTEIDELDIAGVEEGQEASVVFDAFEDEVYEGKVRKVSALGTNVGGVTKYEVTIEVSGVEKAKMAMSATATIVMEEKSDVLLVPVEAIDMVDGQKCVTVVRSGVQETVPVTLGLVNNTEAEVQEGLVEGDQILVKTGSGMSDMVNMIQNRRATILGEAGLGGEA